MRNLKDIITERLIINKNGKSTITFTELFDAIAEYQWKTEGTFKSVYLWPITKTPKLLNFSYNAYLDSVFMGHHKDTMITVQFLGRNKRKTRIYIDNDEELYRTFDEKTITELYNYFTSFTK